jgi:FkbM family methyltransferase
MIPEPVKSRFRSLLSKGFVLSVLEVPGCELRGYREFDFRCMDFRLETPSPMAGFEAAFAYRTEGKVYNDLLGELDEESVFYDVGSNIGFYTCIGAFKAGKTIAFDPNPLAVEEVEKNLEINNLAQNVRVVNAALSNEEGKCSFTERNNLSGRVRVVEGSDADMLRADTEVEDAEWPSPDIVKIDVEGHEKQVIEGFENILDQVKVFYVECTGNKKEEIERFLGDKGFESETLQHRFDSVTHVKFKRPEPEQ